MVNPIKTGPEEAVNKTEKLASLNLTRRRKARILLRKVDLTLRDDGVEAAIAELMNVRLTTPLNPTIREWLRDFRDMLDAWQAGIMPEVVEEFNAFGFRRARNLARRFSGMVSERKATFYFICERVFEQMEERFRLSISDLEEEYPQVDPKEPDTMSLDDVSEEQLSHAIKY